VSGGRRERRFRAGDTGWLVKIIWVQPPGAAVASQFYQVRHGSYLVRETIDVSQVRRVLGDDLFAQLQEVDL